MKLLYLLVVSRMKRQKIRLLFVFLAIAASACLIVWTIGGYQSLFSESMKEEADYLGRYDLRIGALPGGSKGMSREGGAFPGPFSTRPSSESGGQSNSSLTNRPNLNSQKDIFQYARTKGNAIELAKTEKKVPGHIYKKLRALDKDQDGFLNSTEQKEMRMNKIAASRARQGGPDRSGKSPIVLPQELVTAIKTDPGTVRCDEFVSVRGYVYSPKMKTYMSSSAKAEKSTEQSDGNRSESEQYTENGRSASGLTLDRELHRRALAAYRSEMGLPMALGSSFWGTDANDPPSELADGRWLSDTNRPVPEAVLTAKGAERLKVRPGERIVILTKTAEFQLEVVGLIEDRLYDGFYVSIPMATKINGRRPTTSALGLQLRISAEEFRDRWEKRLATDAPGAQILTEKAIADYKNSEAKQQDNLFRYQAISGTLLAVLASIFIVFTALNLSINDQKRQIAFYRTVGLTRSRIAASVLFESLLLVIPGWLGGILVGWLLLLGGTGKVIFPDVSMFGFSFLSSVLGALAASFYPMLRSVSVQPLEAINESEDRQISPERSKHRFCLLLFCTVCGLLFIAADLYLVYGLSLQTERKALLHSGVGLLFLALGVLLLIPFLIRLTESIFLPILAFLFRFNREFLRSELSGNIGRTLAVTLVLSIGGGLFVSMQIWGYSMLRPFVPGHGMPDQFAAFLPIGLNPEVISELKNIPGVNKKEFLPIAVEQAAFADGSSTGRDGRKSPFANVVFFGAEPEQAFGGARPLVGMHYLQGNRQDALLAMKMSRGVVITDSIAVDYQLKFGDILKTVHPKDPTKILEYPIVGVVSFPGWQWLSKTGGVRRNFGRSGGLVFADQNVIRNDYQLERFSYFWYNTDVSRSYTEMESDLDRLAQKNLTLDRKRSSDRQKNKEKSANGTAKKGATGSESVESVYVKLSTRDSLYQSIVHRADSVIWGLCRMPLITLAITSIAVIGVITNSVRARRRQYGILRAVGVTRGGLVRVILVEAVLIGLVAAMSSFLFGFLAAQGALKLGQSMFGTVDPPLILPITGLLFGLALTLVLCLTAALWPALRTGFQEPLKLLQEGRDSN